MRRLFLVLALLGLFPLNACGDVAPVTGKVRVVAAENFWGSIAAQLGGDRIEVTSLISAPGADPHDYEPTTSDGRAVADAQVLIVNGAGYDPWATRLADASPSSARELVNVATIAGRKEGDNPHMWYAPVIVTSVILAITDAYKRADPAGAATYDTLAATFARGAMRDYDGLRTSIGTTYGDVPVGCTESIFEDMATSLGLHLISPPGFMRAVSQGEEPSAADTATMETQVRTHQIKVLIQNSQNTAPDSTLLISEANSAGIPVVAVTETPPVADQPFQVWQAKQLSALRDALAQATGR